MFKSRRKTTSGTGFQDRSSLFCEQDNNPIALTEVAYDVHGGGSNKKYSFCFWMKRTTYDWDRILNNYSAPNQAGGNKFILLGDEARKDEILLECDTDDKRIKTDQHEGKLNTWYKKKCPLSFRTINAIEPARSES